MKIVVTPMCEEILKWNNLDKYIVNKFPDNEENVDLAILLSESDTKYPKIKLKLNTFKQIKESTIKVSEKLNTKPIDFESLIKQYPKAENIINNLKNYQEKNKNIKIKVYSEFLKDIVKDLGFNISNDNYDYVVYPDYLNIKDECSNLIKISSHGNISNNPLERAVIRYSTILNKIY